MLRTYLIFLTLSSFHSSSGLSFNPVPICDDQFAVDPEEISSELGELATASSTAAGKLSWNQTNERIRELLEILPSNGSSEEASLYKASLKIARDVSLRLANYEEAESYSGLYVDLLRNDLDPTGHLAGETFHGQVLNGLGRHGESFVRAERSRLLLLENKRTGTVSFQKALFVISAALGEMGVYAPALSASEEANPAYKIRPPVLSMLPARWTLIKTLIHSGIALEKVEPLVKQTEEVMTEKRDRLSDEKFSIFNVGLRSARGTFHVAKAKSLLTAGDETSANELLTKAIEDLTISREDNEYAAGDNVSTRALDTINLAEAILLQHGNQATLDNSEAETDLRRAEEYLQESLASLNPRHMVNARILHQLAKVEEIRGRYLDDKTAAARAFENYRKAFEIFEIHRQDLEAHEETREYLAEFIEFRNAMLADFLSFATTQKNHQIDPEFLKPFIERSGKISQAGVQFKTRDSQLVIDVAATVTRDPKNFGKQTQTYVALVIHGDHRYFVRLPAVERLDAGGFADQRSIFREVWQPLTNEFWRRNTNHFLDSLSFSSDEPLQGFRWEKHPIPSDDGKERTFSFLPVDYKYPADLLTGLRELAEVSLAD